MNSYNIFIHSSSSYALYTTNILFVIPFNFRRSRYENKALNSKEKYMRSFIKNTQGNWVSTVSLDLGKDRFRIMWLGHSDDLLFVISQWFLPYFVLWLSWLKEVRYGTE